MPRGAASRRYAKALFELARDDGRVEEVGGELEALGRLLDEEPRLRDVLLQPIHPAGERRRVLEAVGERLEASPLVQHFYSFLIDQRRLVDFDGIREEYARLAVEAAGVTKARLLAARPLRDEQRERLRAALSARVGRELELEVEVDPQLLGGVVAQIGDLVFDGSLRTHLAQLRANLTGR